MACDLFWARWRRRRSAAAQRRSGAAAKLGWRAAWRLNPQRAPLDSVMDYPAITLPVNFTHIQRRYMRGFMAHAKTPRRFPGAAHGRQNSPHRFRCGLSLSGLLLARGDASLKRASNIGRWRRRRSWRRRYPRHHPPDQRRAVPARRSGGAAESQRHKPFAATRGQSFNTLLNRSFAAG